MSIYTVELKKDGNTLLKVINVLHKDLGETLSNFLDYELDLLCEITIVMQVGEVDFDCETGETIVWGE